MNLVQKAIADGLITFRPQYKHKKRGPKPDPEIQAKYRKAKNLWEQQLGLEDVCRICGISINTFRSKYYDKGNKKQRKTK